MQAFLFCSKVGIICKKSGNKDIKKPYKMIELSGLNVSEHQKNIILKSMDKMGHEQVLFCRDKKTGLKAIIAIHDTTMGPSLGGVRIWDYKNEFEALEDALRLSRGMTYKLQSQD